MAVRKAHTGQLVLGCALKEITTVVEYFAWQ